MAKGKKQEKSNEQKQRKSYRPIETIAADIAQLDRAWILKFIVFLLVSSILLEVVVILLSTKHVAYVINTFDIENIMSTHRVSMWKQYGTYGAMAFEFALVVILVGSMIAKMYNMYSWKNGFSIGLFLFVNFVGNMYYMLMLYPYLRPDDKMKDAIQASQDVALKVTSGDINLMPISTTMIESVDWLYWFLGITFFGILPPMSWVLMSNTYMFFTAYREAKKDLSENKDRLLEEMDSTEKRNKHNELQNKSRKKNTGDKAMTLGEYVENSEVR